MDRTLERRQVKIAELVAQQEALLSRASTAENPELWRIRGLLAATERALRWHRARLADPVLVKKPTRRASARHKEALERAS